MKQVIIEREKIYRGNLLLVNASYPLKNTEKERKKGLVPACVYFPAILLKRDAANILQMVLEKISPGSLIVPVSGYRTQKEQEDIYNGSLRDNGEEFTKKYVALPCHSEHQTGLAIDLGLYKEKIDFIRPDFPYTGICNKFRKAASAYGFIERYQKDKEDITGSIAHAAMLGKQGIISQQDAALIQKTLKEMKIPLCVVWGKQNKYNTSEQMETIQNIRPHDTYFLFENTRMLPHFENSEVFNESIHSFLQ